MSHKKVHIEPCLSISHHSVTKPLQTTLPTLLRSPNTFLDPLGLTFFFDLVKMKFPLALLALVPVVAFAAPLEPRQGGVAVNCGGKSYSASQVNRAISNALSGQYSSSGYPHTYNNYEGFDFSEYCNGPYKEYPLKTSSSGYTGGSPGADRVVYDSNDGTFCGAVSVSILIQQTKLQPSI